jgi:hypothetical protein
LKKKEEGFFKILFNNFLLFRSLFFVFFSFDMLLCDSHDMKYSDIYLYNHRYNFVSLHKTIGFKIKSISFCRLGLILRFNRLIMILVLNKSFNIGANSVGLIGKLPFVCFGKSMFVM